MKSQNNQLSKLIKEFSRILSLKFNVQETNNLYFHWINYNSSYYTKYYSLLAILIYALLIPFDFLLFDNPFKFTQNRIIVILILFCSLFFYYLKINNSVDFYISHNLKIYNAIFENNSAICLTKL